MHEKLNNYFEYLQKLDVTHASTYNSSTLIIVIFDILQIYLEQKDYSLTKKV